MYLLILYVIFFDNITWESLNKKLYHFSPQKEWYILIYFLRLIFFYNFFYFVVYNLENNLWKYYEDYIFLVLYIMDKNIDFQHICFILIELNLLNYSNQFYFALCMYKWLRINDTSYIFETSTIYFQYILLNSNLPITFLLFKVPLLT